MIPSDPDECETEIGGIESGIEMEKGREMDVGSEITELSEPLGLGLAEVGGVVIVADAEESVLLSVPEGVAEVTPSEEEEGEGELDGGGANMLERTLDRKSPEVLGLGEGEGDVVGLVGVAEAETSEGDDEPLDGEGETTDEGVSVGVVDGVSVGVVDGVSVGVDDSGWNTLER